MFNLKNVVQVVSIAIGVILGVWIMPHIPFDPPGSSYRVHESWLSLSDLFNSYHVLGWYFFVQRIWITVTALILLAYSAYVGTYFMVATWAGVTVNPIRIPFYGWGDRSFGVLFACASLVFLIMLSYAWILIVSGLGYWGLVVLGKRLSQRWSPIEEKEG